MPCVEVGLAIVDRRRLKALGASPSLNGSDIAVLLGDASVAHLVPANAALSHLYFGSEFCEHLFPNTDAILSAVDVASRQNLKLVLATPAANDALVARIGAAAAMLPDSAEILVNDWGVASFLRAAHPDRRLIAGRQLAKMIKDPRAPSAAWATLYPSSVGTRGHRRVLARLGIERIELDVPPFATPELFAISGLEVSVWAPYAYVAKGRICKIGSQSQDLPERFAPGRRCHRECLGVVEAGVGASAAGVVPFARGNTLCYRHSAAMADVVRDALAVGHVTRLVLGGV